MASEWCGLLNRCCLASGGVATGTCEADILAQVTSIGSEAAADGATWDAVIAGQCHRRHPGRRLRVGRPGAAGRHPRRLRRHLEGRRPAGRRLHDVRVVRRARGVRWGVRRRELRQLDVRPGCSPAGRRPMLPRRRPWCSPAIHCRPRAARASAWRSPARAKRAPAPAGPAGAAPATSACPSWPRARPAPWTANASATVAAADGASRCSSATPSTARCPSATTSRIATTSRSDSRWANSVIARQWKALSDDCVTTVFVISTPGIGLDPGADARAEQLSILGLGRGEDLDRVELLSVHQIRNREVVKNCAHRASPASVHFPIRP